MAITLSLAASPLPELVNTGVVEKTAGSSAAISSCCHSLPSAIYPASSSAQAHRHTADVGVHTCHVCRRQARTYRAGACGSGLCDGA
mmetsp:Transcript_22529/g.61827  ORF Transcript_22529/g.61827 Transcript_22529/m.61827 type:complete len:87 (-) Transcript_22529:1062-1322(-)|eukprot:scaffold237597_cov37-Tisochrysis_lutea.AAC.2